MKTRLKKCRKMLGLTQQKFADKLSVRRDYIGKLECGNSEFSKQFFFRLYSVFPEINKEYIELGVGEPLQKVETADTILEHIRMMSPEAQDELAEFCRKVLGYLESPGTIPIKKKSDDTADNHQISNSKVG